MGSPEILVFYCPSCWAETSIRAGLCPRGGADMEAVQEGRDVAGVSASVWRRAGRWLASTFQRR